MLTPEEIRDLVSRAGVAGAPSEDLVLVFCGRWRETLDAYDRDGRLLGAAARVDGRNKQAGYRYHYEFDYERPDARVHGAVRDVTGSQIGFRPSPSTFAVLDADGVEHASVVATGQGAPTIWGVQKPNEFEITRVGLVLGHFRRMARPGAKRPAEHLSNEVWYLHDEGGRDLARISFIHRHRPNNAYVVEIDPTVTEPLRTIAPTFCVVADNLLVDRARSSTGGG